MTSVLTLPRSIAPEWPLLSDFLGWYNPLISEPGKSSCLQEIGSLIEAMASDNELIRQHTSLFVFDLFRGCWAAQKFDNAGGSEGEIQARQQERGSNDRKKAELAKMAGTLQSALLSAASWHGGGADIANPRSLDSVDEALFVGLSPSRCREVADALETIAGVLGGNPWELSAKQPSLGCLVYLDQAEETKYFPVAARKPPSDKGAKPKVANMLAFDLVCRVSCWLGGSYSIWWPREGPNPQGFGLVAELLSLFFPDECATAEDVRGKYGDLTKDGGKVWRPWPAELEQEPGPDSSGLLWGLSAAIKQGG